MQTANKLTRAVSSVAELDAVDVQRHSEVHRPPRVRCRVGVNTRTTIVHIRSIVAVVGVTGGIRTCVVAVNADLVCRTIESDVHIEASSRRHCASPLRYVALQS